MRRTMVVGAAILALLAVIGIGVAAYSAGVDEGISRQVAQSGHADQVVRVVGHGWGWGYGPGFGFPFGLILFPLFVIGIVLLVRYLRSDHSGQAPTAPTAEQVLAERFARGEINETEYRDRLATLHGQVRT